MLTAAATKKSGFCGFYIFYILTKCVFVCKTYFFVGFGADVQVWDASGQEEVPLIRPYTHTRTHTSLYF